MSLRHITSFTLLAFGLYVGLGAAQVSAALPAGTTIPIEFPHALNASTLHIGDAVNARTMQRVQLENGAAIPKGAQVVGRVVAAGGSALAIQFDSVRFQGHSTPLHAGLRAMASFAKSYGSREAFMSNGEPQASVYRQIGGDYYSPESAVYSPTGAAVGQDTRDGIFVKLASNPAAGQMVCNASDRPQAVGVFSSEACGLYGFDNLAVSQSVDPAAPIAIQFQSPARAVKIGAWTTMLLQEVGTAR